MIRTEWAGDAARFGCDKLPLFAYTAATERANALRCAAEDVLIARGEFVVRAKQLGSANRDRFFGKLARSTAFSLFNRARHALNRAEAALASLRPLEG